MVLLFRREGIRGLPPWTHVAVDPAKPPHRVLAGHAAIGHHPRERLHVAIVRRPETSVTSPVERGTQRAASGSRHRPQARLAARDHHAYVTLALALHADAVGRQHGLRSREQ